MPNFGTCHKERQREGTGVVTNTNLGEMCSIARDQMSGWAGQGTVKAEDVREGSSLPCTRLDNQSSCLFVTRKEHAFWNKVAVFYEMCPESKDTSREGR